MKLIQAALQADPNVKEVSIQDDQVAFCTHDHVDEEENEYDWDSWQGVSDYTKSTIMMLKGAMEWNECPGCENEGSVTLG